MQVVIDGLFLVEPQYSKKNIAFCLFHTIAASCTYSHRLLLQSKSLDVDSSAVMSCTESVGSQFK
jgi:hypothetical protein